MICWINVTLAHYHGPLEMSRSELQHTSISCHSDVSATNSQSEVEQQAIGFALPSCLPMLVRMVSTPAMELAMSAKLAVTQKTASRERQRGSGRLPFGLSDVPASSSPVAEIDFFDRRINVSLIVFTRLALDNSLLRPRHCG